MEDLLALYENVIVDEGDAAVNNNAATLDEHSVDHQLWKALNQGDMQQLHTLLSMIKSRNSISFRPCLEISIDAAVKTRASVFAFSFSPDLNKQTHASVFNRFFTANGTAFVVVMKSKTFWREIRICENLN